MSWLYKLTSIAFAAPPTGNQSVDISFRQGGTSGAFTTPATVIFKPDGTINGIPNPYIITGIDDSWTTMDIKSTNQCNGIDVITTVNKP